MTNMTCCDAINAILHMLADTKSDERQEILSTIAATYIAERNLNGIANDETLEGLKKRSEEILSAINSGRGKVSEGLAA